MKKIMVLDHKTIDKIAAGEVIERPFSIVKELVENAIDAGSTAITVEIKRGGIDFIRVTDNGEGIAKDEVRNAFLRHATSKIKTVDDLFTINSLGFRGEALASIASVCQMELITKVPNAIEGIHFRIEGGTEDELTEIGAPNGTTFIARNIFYNTPARKKFLKSDATEASYISSLMERLALSNPTISFKFINNNQTKLFTTGNDNSKEIIYHIYGREIAGQLIEVKEEHDGIKVKGYIGKPGISRGNRNFENYYINGRYTRNKVVTKGLEDAYSPYLMQHRYPFTVLFIDMDTNELDVNVHPAKMEVRFMDARRVYESVHSIIENALSKKEHIPSIEWEHVKKQTVLTSNDKVSYPEPFEIKRLEKEIGIPAVIREETGYDLNIDKLASGSISDNEGEQNKSNSKTALDAKVRLDSWKEKTTLSVPDKANQNDKNLVLQERDEEVLSHVSKADQWNDSEKEVDIVIGSQLHVFEDSFISKKSKSDYRMIGQIFRTYWLVEWKDALYFMDQHAAHEKVLYEDIVKAFHNKEITSQYLLPPLVISLTMDEEQILMDYMEYFKELGFEIEHFGGKEYSVRAVPSNLPAINEHDFFIEILDELSSITKRDDPVIISEKIASMACKGAVKGNQSLSEIEISALFDQLILLENPYFCPHGRPTLISMTKKELEKKFKRIL